MNNRETVFAALFAKVAAIPGIITAKRRIVSWDDVPPTQMPALYQLQHGQEARWKQGAPQIWVLHADLFLYVDVRSNQDQGPQALNNLLDAVETALGPDNYTGVCTLGGLVSHCRISSVEIFEGVQGGTAIAVISIEILTT